jgi:hypothetical protein
MDYEKYRCSVVEEDHTLLGKLGIEESTVASMKKGLKTAAGLATSAVATIANTGKVLAPGVAHATSLVAGGLVWHRGIPQLRPLPRFISMA